MKKWLLTLSIPTALLVGVAVFFMMQKPNSTKAERSDSMQVQQSKFPQPDKSSMDMSFFPVGYAVLKIQNKVTEPLVARVLYSRPAKMGRKIFGELVEYGKVWRLGANEASEIEFFRDVKINNKKVPKGRYTMYAIPNETRWTVIINRDTDTWGAFAYDAKKDEARIDLPVQASGEQLEFYTMVFEKATGGMNLVMAWESVMVKMPITY